MRMGRPPEQPFPDPTAGWLLGSERILGLLKDGWIFEPDTWLDERVRPAGYDLVIARDDLQIPDPSDPDKLRTYAEGSPFPDSAFHLRPGDFAFVTTRERLCLPWTVAGNVGVRNRFATKGLLVLTGLIVDPGYGLEEEDGTWVKRPKRLHFGIANVGQQAVNIALERDAIASIQFFVVGGNVYLKGIGVPQPDEGKRGFVLFADFEKKLNNLEQDLVSTRASTESTVTLGLYLLLATLVGAVTAIVIGAVSNEDISQRLSTALGVIARHPLAAGLVTLTLVAFAVILASLFMLPLAKLLTGRRTLKKRR
jgi:deoxycytidine triphosphate deaminase